jgi:two-component system osmolarity sensor histidine kinase EnvZ
MKLAVELMDDSEELKADITEMEQMLDGFLAFARDNQVEAGQPVDPIALAQTVAQKCGDIPVKILRSTADNKNVVLRQDAITRALQNLISNAQHFGKTVHLSVALSQRFLEYRVEDDGPGIPPEDFERAIQPFARLDEARGHHAGMGLGLSIALDIARAHGGTLELGKSEALGGLSAKIVVPR